MDLTAMAADVAGDDAVTITGMATRGGPCAGARVVRSPGGIDWFEPAEMTVCCGAATPVAVLDAALAECGQMVELPAGGTVGGALAVGASGLLRLGRGALRDSLLQARYISAAGEVVKVGGPTVKNVSGFDLCRLLVGSRGTLGFLGEVILRTRPRPAVSRWFSGVTDPWKVLTTLYRPAAVLWDGTTTWACLEGHGADVAAQAASVRLDACDGPPPLPRHRWSLPPTRLAELTGEFVAEIGVGTVHRGEPQPARPMQPAVAALHARLKHEFDPTGRLNPGVDFAAGQGVR